MKEPTGVISQRRHIKSRENPELTYELTQVVRYYPPEEVNEGGVEDRLQALFDVTDETTAIWFGVAEAIAGNREGFEYKRKYSNHLPVVEGAPHVTVWGVIFDVTGRTLTLTVTDRMSAYEAFNLCQLGIVAWDNVSDYLNEGNDANRWGAAPVRGTTVKSAPSSTTKTSAQSTAKKNEVRVKRLVNLDEAESLPAGTRISFPVTYVNKTDKMVHIYSGKRYVYFYIDSSDFGILSTKLAKHRSMPGENSGIEPDAQIEATVELLDSKAGKRYYKFIDIQLAN